MKKTAKILLSIILIIVMISSVATADPETIESVIAAMMENITGEEFKMPGGKPGDFDQKIEYDEKTNEFTHYVAYPAWYLGGYALTLDLDDPETIPMWEELWEQARKAAEVWIFGDAVAAIKIKGATFQMKFVTVLDTTSEDYIILYALKMTDDYKIEILENFFTDDFEPVALGK